MRHVSAAACREFFVIAVALGCAALPLAHAQAASSARAPGVVDVLAADGRFTQFRQALERTGLAGALREPGTYTVIAPTDAAFARLAPAARERLLRSPSFVLDHIVYGEVPAAGTASTGSGSLVAASGRVLAVVMDSQGGRLIIDRARVAPGRLLAANGTVVVVEGVSA